MTSLAPYEFAQGTAVVTGAASGIGEHLARQLAALGSHLVLLDRDGPRVQAVADSITSGHPMVAVDVRVADLAETEAIAALAQGLIAAHPRITLLVNNAGVSLAGDFRQLTMAEFDWVMRVNFDAPVALTHHLLPTLMQTRGSHIVNVSSVFGLVAPPGQSAYVASKFALRGFSQALAAEVLPRGVGVTTVHPGGVRTRIVENSRVAAGASPAQVAAGRAMLSRALTYPPERAAAEILAGVRRRRARVLVGMSAKVPDLAARVAPVGHATLLGRLARRTRRGTARTSGSRAPRG